MARDFLSPAGKLRSWLVYSNLSGLIDFQRDFGLDCRGCTHALQGESSIFCRYFDEEVHDYRLAETCEAHENA